MVVNNVVRHLRRCESGTLRQKELQATAGDALFVASVSNLYHNRKNGVTGTLPRASQQPKCFCRTSLHAVCDRMKMAWTRTCRL